MASAIISPRNNEAEIALSVQVWKEGPTHIAYTPELDISSCGKTTAQAKSHLREAVSLFMEEAARMGSLGAILEESGLDSTFG